jgi:hypothetical protein
VRRSNAASSEDELPDYGTDRRYGRRAREGKTNKADKEGKRAREPSAESSLDSRHYESEDSQLSKGKTSSDDDAGDPAYASRPLCATRMLAHWGREAKAMDKDTQHECKRVLRLLRAYARAHPTSPKHPNSTVLKAFSDELASMVIEVVHGREVAAAYNTQNKAHAMAGGLDQRLLDKAIKRQKSLQASKYAEASERYRARSPESPHEREPPARRKPEPRREHRREPRRETRWKTRRERPEPRRERSTAPAGPVCFKCKETGHRAKECKKP